MQNVNLYLPEYRPNSTWLTEKSVIFAASGLVIVLVLITFLEQLNLSKYEQSVIESEEQNLVQRSEVEKIKAQRPNYAIQTLDEEIERLRLEIDNRQRVIELIGRKNLGNVKGFSSRLKELAQYSSPDISIQHFRFSGGSARVEIFGSSLNAHAPVNLVDQLQITDSYSQTGFGPLTISDQDSSGVYRFSFGFESLFNHRETLVGANP